jgi:hypothetical protein
MASSTVKYFILMCWEDRSAYLLCWRRNVFGPEAKEKGSLARGMNFISASAINHDITKVMGH